MATSKSKKEILDYLWEWAENSGYWSKLLVKTTVEKEVPLSEDEFSAVYDEILKSIIPSYEKTSATIQRPELRFESSNLILQSMTNIKGVNRLAENQTLDFSSNTTVIYGENATGKSGYSRILKAIGSSYEKKTKVLCNVYSTEKVSQNAKITYTLDDNEDEFVWDGF
ncbi:hypothetical protein MUP95_06830, partial [bacterium]|nr:hypothetical protein [bacterium]